MIVIACAGGGLGKRVAERLAERVRLLFRDPAKVVLRDPSAHLARTYELTGPETMTLAEAAAIIGGGVRYHAETIPEAYASRVIYHAPAWQVDAWVSTYTAIAAGDLDRVTTNVEKLTGHPATALSDVLRRRA